MNAFINTRVPNSINDTSKPNTQSSNIINLHSTKISIYDSEITTTPLLKANPPILDPEYLVLKQSTRRLEHHPVEPLYTNEEIQRVKDYLYNTPSRYKETNMRNYAYFCLAINVPKRAGDILNLKIHDIMNEDGTLKSHIWFAHEQKTYKSSDMLFTPNAQSAMLEYLNLLPFYKMSDDIFQNYKTGEKMTVDGMRKMLKRMSKAIGLKQNIATHSLRKTWATHADNNYPEERQFISTALAHSNIETTSIYTCKQQKQLDAFMLKNQR